jgi:L-fuculose-phosphate aldolase
VRVAAYATFGTPEIARNAVKAIKGRTACLLANHGMICHAASVEAALLTAVRLEAMARQYMIARAAGDVRLLTAAEIEATITRYKTYGQRGQL